MVATLDKGRGVVYPMWWLVVHGKISSGSGFPCVNFKSVMVSHNLTINPNVVVNDGTMDS